MLVFWQHGFDGASLTDLTEAMGVNRPSLYATFGDKQSLYDRAVDRYADKGQSVFNKSDARLTARDFVETLLRGQADLYTEPGLPAGCFFIQSAISTSTSSQAARLKTAERRRLNELAVRRRLEHAEAKRELPAGLTSDELAAYVASVGNGLAIRAADGAKRKELYRIVELALAFWPAGIAPAINSENRAKPRPPKNSKPSQSRKKIFRR